MSPKTEIIFPTIDTRMHCIDLIIKNIEQAIKPEVQILIIATGSDEYASYVEEKFKKFIKKVRVVKTKDRPIDHDEIRYFYHERKTPDKKTLNIDKLENIRRTYQTAVDNCDKEMDYYWIIEDDTIFPLDVYERYMHLLDGLKADVITGVSYYWHTGLEHQRNFWDIEFKRVFPVGDVCDEMGFSLKPIPFKYKGVEYLGATGLGNVLVKRDAWISWQPMIYQSIGSGADISFFMHCYTDGYDAYGVWNISLPHITIHTDGAIEIRGRADKSLIPLLTGGQIVERPRYKKEIIIKDNGVNLSKNK